ncbi:MAG: accessory gene regulator ArgB-like protein [Bacillota bacterium]
MGYLRFSTTIAGFLTKKTNGSRETELILSYAVEVLVINLANVLATLILGFVLGVFTETIVCLVTVAFFRHTAGGAHSNSPWRCAVVTVAVFPFMALLGSQMVKYMNYDHINMFCLGSLLLGFMIISLLAPVGSAAAPIKSKKRKYILKVLALCVLLAIAVTQYKLTYSSLDNAAIIKVCLTLGVLWECFLLSAIGHKSLDFIDRVFN